MTFDRAKFDAIVSEKSPLTSAQFDTLFGGNVDGTNKQVAWQILQMSKPEQYGIYMLVTQWQRAFPEAVIASVK